ncbi:unnamed protein product [Cyprideis torosa]|uniref:Uncharacterized protein n=1 Tax=Cyprideis torosa TaxID=163714 RepID=A0A7R8W7L4_9CRUS|nr:unnamed protein product [Cyprideis torosa]CAG0887665.1 unnamed protein product [Cyprideis torosa]
MQDSGVGKSSMLFDSVMTLIPQGHEKPLRVGIYNAAALLFLSCVAYMVLQVYHMVLQPFTQPLLWAILCGSVLHPMKWAFASTMRSWLADVQKSSTPTSVQIALVPLGLLKMLFVHVWELKARFFSMFIMVTVVFFSVAFGQYLCPWTLWETCLSGLEMASSPFIFFASLSRITVLMLLICYVSLLVSYQFLPGRARDVFPYFSIFVFLVTLCSISNTFGTWRFPLAGFILILSLIGAYYELRDFHAELREDREAMEGSSFEEKRYCPWIMDKVAFVFIPLVLLARFLVHPVLRFLLRVLRTRLLPALHSAHIAVVRLSERIFPPQRFRNFPYSPAPPASPRRGSPDKEVLKLTPEMFDRLKYRRKSSEYDKTLDPLVEKEKEDAAWEEYKASPGGCLRPTTTDSVFLIVCLFFRPFRIYLLKLGLTEGSSKSQRFTGGGLLLTRNAPKVTHLGVPGGVPEHLVPTPSISGRRSPTMLVEEDEESELSQEPAATSTPLTGITEQQSTAFSTLVKRRAQAVKEEAEGDGSPSISLAVPQRRDARGKGEDAGGRKPKRGSAASQKGTSDLKKVFLPYYLRLKKLQGGKQDANGVGFIAT